MMIGVSRRNICSHKFKLAVRWQTTGSQTGALSGTVQKFLGLNGIVHSEADYYSDVQEGILSHLERRGLVSQVTGEVLGELVEKKKLGLYCGADPTARSLHLGNLLPLMILLHFNLRGHNITALVGGATGAVGDPSGRATERTAMATDTRLSNVDRIQLQLRRFFENGLDYSYSRNICFKSDQSGIQSFRNNHNWWKDVSLIQFLAEYGGMIRVNQMLSRDSIRSRLESEAGIGFNEFTYQILQAYDFYHLHANENVSIQVGGNDQYGNIVAGIDLISRISKSRGEKNPKPAFGMTVPLLTTASGEKFGKSAGNAVFIDKELTSGYNLYQFMVNTADADVQKFLYKFSLLPLKVIDAVIAKHDQDRSQRIAQRLLAIEVCDLIHGDGEGFSNMVISDLLFGNRDTSFSVNEIADAFERQNLLIHISGEQFGSLSVLALLEKLYFGEKSRSELKKLINAGAVYVGLEKERAKDPSAVLERRHLVEDQVLLIRVGKKDYKVVKVSA
ncbi:unnamed protein product [Kuraishia capsulata CBS 1993]|uniref:Tyrosine--tRNA ligase n=1 Tax=Kuraishia capsulata CBS 1993 TaxID=1382522 RepID=W6MXI4_9ASCO|nr:uncharacterized protein KUCA_T00004931001 [Kuraishia capsulata CBS 1993]CDK28945.1 unnamed protein product [Kuraishia capsulata CBS 1993]